MLTEEQKAKYLEKDGSECPYCGGTDLVPDPSEVFPDENNSRACIIECENCCKKWLEIYSLVKIQEINITEGEES